jgi:hypothetical protein
MMSEEQNPDFRYKLGDLVRYEYTRWTEDYRDKVSKIGIVVSQRYCFSTQNRFKIRSSDGEKWIPADHIVEVISLAK